MPHYGQADAPSCARRRNISPALPLSVLQRRQGVLRVLCAMMLTDVSKRAFDYRRFARAALDDGFIPISENGDPLWKFIRGAWGRRRIVATRIAPGGHEVWIKVEGEPDDAYFAR